MASLLERLRAALAPAYEVERELSRGGMGLVFLARQRSLDRWVAIKVLRPEHASATAAARFQREARILASLSHPNVVPIHHVGEADGLFYFVMDYLEGGTLEDRIGQGPLGRAETIRIGIDLLDALERAHAKRILHRDIKPANIFLVDGRAVLSDFGIARGGSTEAEALTEPGGMVGTPAYMSPEQFAGGAAPESDLYALSMVLYECVTGRRWDPTSVESGDWSGVPADLAPLLRRGLEMVPAERWRDARTFRTALQRIARPRRGVAGLAAAAVIALALIAVAILLRSGHPQAPTSRADLAILPFATGPGVDTALGSGLAWTTADHLEAGFTGAGINVVPMANATRWWDSAGRSTDSGGTAARTLHARYVARGRITRNGDRIVVRLTVTDSAGVVRQTAPVRGSATAPYDLGFNIGHELTLIVAPDLETRYHGSVALLGHGSDAVRALIAGERAFQHEMWSRADTLYSQALDLDSSLALAWWRRYKVRDWEKRPVGTDKLDSVYRHAPDAFSELDRLLIEAELAGPGPARLAKYEQAARRYPQNGMPLFLWGNELFARGALFGIALDSAVAVLNAAAKVNPSWAPTFSTLTWALIRMGREGQAGTALSRYHRIGAVENDVGFSLGSFLEMALAERFHPDQAPPFDPGSVGPLMKVLRWAPSLGLLRTERDLGAKAATVPKLDRSERADAHEAEGLALVALGRMHDAMPQFDTAAALFAEPAARLEAAEWRVLPRALGMAGADDSMLATGRRTLAVLTADPAFGWRATWALAMDAYANGDTTGALGYRRQLQGIGEAKVAAALLDALQSAARNDTPAALQTTTPLARPVAWHERGGDPFVRSALHLQRAAWLAPADAAAADREARWYENADLHLMPAGPAQPGEVDWAFGTFGAYRRLDMAEGAERCTVARAVTDGWHGADPAFARLTAAADSIATQCARSRT